MTQLKGLQRVLLLPEVISEHHKAWIKSELYRMAAASRHRDAALGVTGSNVPHKRGNNE